MILIQTNGMYFFIDFLKYDQPRDKVKMLCYKVKNACYMIINDKASMQCTVYNVHHK